MWSGISTFSCSLVWRVRHVSGGPASARLHVLEARPTVLEAAGGPPARPCADLTALASPPWRTGLHDARQGHPQVHRRWRPPARPCLHSVIRSHSVAWSLCSLHSINGEHNITITITSIPFLYSFSHNGAPIQQVEYFRKEYNVVLQFPRVNVLNCGRGQSGVERLFPPEVSHYAH